LRASQFRVGTSTPIGAKGSADLFRHSGARRRREPGISRFPDVQLHI
jgi:hypothetical protein